MNMFAKFSIVGTRTNVRITASAVLMFGVGVDMLIDVSTVLVLDIGFNMLTKVEIVVVTTAAIALEFILKVAHAMEVWAGALGTGVNANPCRLAAGMTALEFSMAAPLEDPSFCD